jgi:hypothetical protein
VVLICEPNGRLSPRRLLPYEMGGDRSANLPTCRNCSKARRIAFNIARLPELLGKADAQ